MCQIAFSDNESSALPTSANFPQDIISHIQVVHRLQVKSMHSLINYLRQKLEAFQSVHHVTFILCYTVLYVFLVSAAASVGTEQRSTGPLVPCICPYQSS